MASASWASGRCCTPPARAAPGCTPSTGSRPSSQVAPLPVPVPGAGAGARRAVLTALLPAGREKSRGVQALAVSPDRRFLAVSETAAEQPVLTVYELAAGQPPRRRRVLTAAELPAREAPVSLAFSPDCRGLAAATGPPEVLLAFWLWDKRRLLATVRLQAPGGGCQVTAPRAGQRPESQLPREASDG